MEIKRLSKSEFGQAVNAGGDLVIVDFPAAWCGSCKMLSPVVERVVDKYGDIHFYKVDVSEEIDLVSRPQIMSVPTLLYVKRSEVAGKSVGFVPPADVGRGTQKSK